MPLKSIAVSGYKAFSKESEFEVRRLTLVYGYNSAGKSSLLRLFPLIRDSLNSSGPAPLTVESPSVRGASASDLFSKSAKNPEMTFRLAFSPPSEISEVRYDFRVLDMLGTRRVVIYRFHIKAQSENRTILLHLPSITGNEAVLRYAEENSPDKIFNSPFIGLMPEPALVRGDTDLERWIGNAKSAIEELTRSIWLGPLRNIPPRIEIDRRTNTEIDAFGNGASNTLAQDDYTSGRVIERVRTWFANNTEYSLQIVRGAHEFGAIYSLAFAPKSDLKMLIPIEDTGEGIAQVLPILTAVALASDGRLGQFPIIAMEHPDLHLHSTVHSKLLGFFIEAIQTPSQSRFIVETHSEAMLLALQTSILEKRIKPSDVILHWIRNDSDGTANITSIVFDEKGYPTGDDWPMFDWYASVHEEMRNLSSKRILGP